MTKTANELRDLVVHHGPRAIQDALDVLWLVWETHDGDVLVTSWPDETGEERNALDFDHAHSIQFPVRVLTPVRISAGGSHGGVVFDLGPGPNLAGKIARDYWARLGRDA